MANWIEYKISSIIAFLIIFLVILPIGFVSYRLWNSTIQTIDASTNISSFDTTTILPKDKSKIQNWILKNNLNQYGDPKNTLYAGGSPLFNENTGQNIDLYSYILQKHPDRPWKK